MKSCLFIPFATISDYNTGANISRDLIGQASDIYLKNLCVAAVSAKINGAVAPSLMMEGELNVCDIAVVVNFSIPPKYKRILERNDINIFYCPFDSFDFGGKYKWSLAFYKLCALKYMIENHAYDNYSFVDADVYIQSSLEYIWRETSFGNILLSDINHGLQVPLYRDFLNEVNLFKRHDIITHYGGEFFAANYSNSKTFMDECEDIYRQMVSSDFKTTMGDEFITSLAAEKLKQAIRNAGAYIFRFETGRFYLISTRYRFNEITILHVPAEKLNGMLKIFDRYVSRGKLPLKQKAWSLLHLTHRSFRTKLSSLRHGLLKKI